MASFIREKEILDLIKKKRVDCIANIIGAYYAIDEEGDIDSLILVSESGEYSLEQILKKRKTLSTKNKNTPFYSPDEVIGFIAQISEAYKAMRELNIYHSDTKLENLVYSKSKKKFLLIDFGASKKIEIEPKNKSSSVNIEVYAGAGTNPYFSPEKEVFWEWRKNNQDSEENYDKPFDPFKCDMYSLGVCVEKMLGINQGDISEKSKGKRFFLDIVMNLKEKDWNKRWDALQLHRYLKKNKLNEYVDNSGIMQTDFYLIVGLNKEKYERKLMSGIKTSIIKSLPYNFFF